MNLKPKANEILLNSDYSSIEFNLPLNFDTLFWKDSIFSIEASAHIPFCVMDDRYLTDTVSLGHKHICLLQFADGIPSAIKELSEVNSPNRKHHELILIRRRDILTEEDNRIAAVSH